MYRERLTSDELEVLLTQDPVVLSSPTPEDAGPRETEKHSDQALVELHSRYAHDLGTLLGELVRREVVVRLRSANLGTYGQFVFGQSVPTCCAVIQVEPIQAEFFLAISPSILFSLIDRLMGSDYPEPPQQRAPPTEIETSVIKLLVDQIVEKYREVWQQVLSLESAVDRLEHNAQQMRALAGGEPTYMVRYDVRCGGDQGWFELCLPWAATQQMRERLAANG